MKVMLKLQFKVQLPKSSAEIVPLVIPAVSMKCNMQIVKDISFSYRRKSLF